MQRYLIRYAVLGKSHWAIVRSCGATMAATRVKRAVVCEIEYVESLGE